MTEDRRAFLPWLRWNFERQTWLLRELVVVTGSEVGDVFEGLPESRLIRVPKGLGIAAKRNVALAHASGDIVAWFDDDDWQHPRRLERIATAFGEQTVVAGWASAWFVDLRGERCARHSGAGRPIFNAAGFRASSARRVRFDERITRASDSPWLRALSASRVGRVVLPGDDGFFWLSHDTNISNPAKRRRFPQGLDALREHLGEAWGDTDAQLAALRQRLWPEHVARQERPPVVPSRVEIRETSATRGDAVAVLQPARVSALIKACALDVPFMRATVPHILAQARHAFDERILLLDRAVEYSGKYRAREGGSLEELDATADALVTAGVVDRVLVVDDAPDRRAEILGTYFGDAAPRVHVRAATGGPIFATLFGLEGARNDLVAQFDCDMLFHAVGGSWIDPAVEALATDPSIWLAMTHGGPPAGDLGTSTSLGRLNGRRAHWDPSLRLWRFATATTRYFLTDRRRLRGRVVHVPRGSGTAPLEDCLTASLRRHRAHRVCIALEGSWDLHPYSHASPFPEWAPRIAALVEEGRVPRMQRGSYDLRLDRPAERDAWGHLVRVDAPTISAERVDRRADACEDRRVDSSQLAVVIPVRDRAGPRLRRCLASLRWQSAGPPAQIVVVSHGSSRASEEELATLCAQVGAELICIGSQSEAWCKPRALNVGIQRARDVLPFVMTLDADMILAPNFLAVVVAALMKDVRAFLMCRSTDLPQRMVFPVDAALRSQFHALRQRGRLRGFHGTGGIQAAARSFFFDVRGYDEDLVWWGAEDGDMLTRAKLAGLQPRWICSATSMLHQWHPKTARALSDPRARSEAVAAWRRNHALVAERANRLVRNEVGWGEMRS